MTFPILGDQPPAQTTGDQIPGDQPGPPPPIDFGEGLRFYVRMQDNPDREDFNQPKALFRFKITDTEIVTDFYNRQKDMWVDWPNMIAFTGIGGAEDFFEIEEQEANDLIAQWNELGPDGEGQPIGGGDSLAGGLIKDDMREAFERVQLSPEEVQARVDQAQAALTEDEEADLRPDFETAEDEAEAEERSKAKKKRKRKKKKKKGRSY